MPLSDENDQPILSRAGARIIAATGLGMMTSVGIMLLYPLGVLIPAISAATSWPAPAVAAAAAPALLVVGICGPGVGLMVDRYGPRQVLLWGVFGQGAGLILLGLATPTFTAFAVLYSFAAFAGAAHAHVPYSQAISGWFRSRRGAAAGIGFGIAGIGVAVVPPLTQLLIQLAGWRMAIVCLGLLAWIVAGAAAILLMRDPPRPNRSAHREHVPSRRSSRARPGFWLLVIAFSANAFAASAGTVSLPTILVAGGVAPLAAASAMGFVGAAVIFGRVVVGVLLDHLPPHGLASAVFLMPVVGCVLVAAATNPAQTIAGGVLFGIALGAEGDLMAYLIARRTDVTAFGRLFGVAYLGYAVASGLGPAGFTLAGGASDLPTSSTLLAVVAIAGSLAIIGAGALDRRAPVERRPGLTR